MRRVSALVFLFSSLTVTAHAASPLADETPRAAPHGDPWVPGSGALEASLATGAPFVVMGELTLGVTNYGALGLLAGSTPIVAGFGVRPRGALPLAPGLRLLLSAPIVFYPEREHGAAWWLMRPSAELDVTPADGVHVALGGGFVAVATEEALFSSGREAPAPASPYGAPGVVRRTDAWGTVNAVSSVALSKRSALIFDATLVLSSSGLAGPDWIGGPPVILFLGASTVL